MPTFFVNWNEDGSATVLARITARDGSGAATGVAGEGNWLQQANVLTITCNVYDLDSATPDTAIATPTVTVSVSVLDTPVTSTALWTVDTTGYNFLHDLARTNFPAGDHRYRIEYEVTLASGSTVFHGVFEGTARPIRTS